MIRLSGETGPNSAFSASRFARALLPYGASVWLLAVWLLLAPACTSGSSEPQPTTGPSTSGTPEAATAPTATAVPISPQPSPTPRPIPGSAFPPDQAATLSDLLARTAQLRGLQPKGDIEARLIGRQATADYLESTVDEKDRELINTKQELYRVLGLIPDDADLLQLQISLLRALVLGFYDPDVKTLFVLQDLGLTSLVTRTTIVHEMVHALQDQYYDLNAIDERIRGDWDMSMAFADLVEGDARGVETEFALPSTANNAALACDDSSFNVNRNSNIPAVIQRELQAPYSDGRCFIFSVKGSLPDGVDSIFADLPKSTEQVLHPQKYLAGEAPKAVDLEPLAGKLGPGWSEKASSTFGEFALQNLLLLGVNDRATVKRGADGWGGDRWALYARADGARLAHLQIAWDSQSEAREFWDIFVRSLNDRSGGRLQADSALNSVSWDQGAKKLRARIFGDSVTILVSTDADAARAAASALGLE